MYVKDQMGPQLNPGHRRHLRAPDPGATVSFVDRLDVDEKSCERAEDFKQQNATQAQLPEKGENGDFPGTR